MTLYLAAYDAAGKQLEIYTLATRNGSNSYDFTLTCDAAYVKAFLLKDERPVCNSKRS